jgi:ribonuclease E
MSRRRGRRRKAAPAEGAPPAAPTDAATGLAEPMTLFEGLEPHTEPTEGLPSPAEPAEGTPAQPHESAEEPARPKSLMLINVVEPEECRVGLLEGSHLEGLYIERASVANTVGNIYKGVVVNLEPSIQAAFVDFGEARHGFLHISDVVEPSPASSSDGQVQEPQRFRRRSIQDILHRGQEIVVQVTRAGIGNKGPALTTFLSIPGRYLVLMPESGRAPGRRHRGAPAAAPAGEGETGRRGRPLGVSRKIEDETERLRLRDILKELSPPEGLGFIIRTAASAISGNRQTAKRELARDLNYLVRLWNLIVERVSAVQAPAEIYRESDLVIRTMRDIFSADVERVLVDDAEVASRAREFVQAVMPRYADRIQTYEGVEPLFHKYGVEAEVDKINQRRVGLPGGGSIVIEQTEALVAIDVNTGTFRTRGDAEETIFRTNLVAAREIPRQLRLRDLGGLIIIDFIDMREEGHKRQVEQTLREAIRRDRAHTKVLRMSQFCIVEMTRQRQKMGVERALFEDCPACKGVGRVKSAESMALDIMRRLNLLLSRPDVAGVEIHLNESVAHYIVNRKRRAIIDLEEETKKRIVIRVDHELGVEDTTTICYGSSGETIKIGK